MMGDCDYEASFVLTAGHIVRFQESSRHSGRSFNPTRRFVAYFALS